MCRNIKTLHNFEPPATEDEVRASALQFVRKLSGFTKPSKANEPAFHRAVEQVTQAARELLDSSRYERAASRPRGGSNESPRQGGGPLSLGRGEAGLLTLSA